jgi:hypothetical protein
MFMVTACKFFLFHFVSKIHHLKPATAGTDLDVYNPLSTKSISLFGTL